MAYAVDPHGRARWRRPAAVVTLPASARGGDGTPPARLPRVGPGRRVAVPKARGLGLGLAVAAHAAAALLFLAFGTPPIPDQEGSDPLTVHLLAATTQPPPEPMPVPRAPDLPSATTPSLPVPRLPRLAAVPVRATPAAPAAPAAVAVPATPPQASPSPPPVPAARPTADASASYHQQVLARLQDHRRYPTAARAHRQQGVARLRFTLGRDGRVLAQGVSRSSGHALLDREALDTLRRAHPLPPVPADLAAPLELVVDVDFFVGR